MNLNRYSKRKYPKLLTEQEKDAIFTYTEDNFEINNCLRFNRSMRANIEEKVQFLDLALSKFQLDNSLIVYRNINMIIDDFFDEYIDAITSGSFTDLGYTSCTTIRNLYAKVANIKLQILLEPCVNGAYIKYLSSFREENEFLLARGTTFETLDYSIDNGVHKVMCKVQNKKRTISSSRF